MIVTGVQQTLNNMSNFTQRVQNKMMRQAMRKATRPMRTAIKNSVRVDTGALKSQIDAKVKNYPNGACVGIVGAKTGMVMGKRPSKTFHLVEKGTFRSRAFPVVAPAAVTHGQQCIQIFEVDLAAQINNMS